MSKQRDIYEVIDEVRRLNGLLSAKLAAPLTEHDINLLLEKTREMSKRIRIHNEKRD